MRIILILLSAMCLSAQTVPEPLQVTRMYSVTGTAQVFDNRSITRQCNVFGYTITAAAGSWATHLEYANGSLLGPWFTYGAIGSLTNASGTFVAGGFGYHDFVRLNVTSGTVAATISCEKDFLYPLGPGSGGGANPVGENGAIQYNSLGAFGGLPLGAASQVLHGNASGAATWGLVNLADEVSGLLSLGNGGTGANTAVGATHNLQFQGVGNTPIADDFWMSGLYIDVRNFGAVGVTGNCHATSVDDQPQIQAALQYAHDSGPLNVYLPAGYCWPIASHLWVPPGVRLYSDGRAFGYEASSPGSIIIANANYQTNQTFPYSQMVWLSGDNFTSGSVTATNVTFATELDHVEINCNDVAGCGNIYAIGRQEKSSVHNVTLSGSAPPTNGANGGYHYGWYEQGVDCNGSGGVRWGCLIPNGTSPPTGNPDSGQQGPDYHIEIFPSFNVSSSTFIPWALMGAADYKGLLNSTINCIGYASPAAAYLWGTSSVIGPGVHIEGCTGAEPGLSIGVIPDNISGCNGGNSDVFIGLDQTTTIQNCDAQTDLTFIGLLTNGSTPTIVNNVSGAPLVNVLDSNYYYDSATQTAGVLGSKNGFSTPGPINIVGVGSVGGLLNLNAPSTAASPELRWSFGSSTQLRIVSSLNGGGPNYGITVKSQRYGVLFQDLTTTADMTGGGLFVWGNGYPHDTAWGGIGSGFYGDGGTLIATASTAAGIDIKDGSNCLWGAGGLTPGSTFAYNCSLKVTSATAEFDVIPTFKAGNVVGSGVAAFGANSPAITLSAPYTWLTVILDDGSTGYIPVWK